MISNQVPVKAAQNRNFKKQCNSEQIMVFQIYLACMVAAAAGSYIGYSRKHTYIPHFLIPIILLHIHASQTVVLVIAASLQPRTSH